MLERAPLPQDSLTLTGLRAFAHHGVFAHERAAGQEFVVDVTVWLSVHDAAVSDDLALTINYGLLAEQIVGAVETTSTADLIETVAERVADVVLEQPRAERVEVVLHKPSAPITVPFADVAVTITRERV